MSSVDAWLALADRVALLREQPLRERLTDLLAGLLAMSGDRSAVAADVEGRRDDAALLLGEALSRSSSDGPAFGYAPAPEFSDAAAGRARAAAASLARGADATPDDLVALSPDAAAVVVTELVSQARYDVLARVVVALPPHRLPVPLLLRTAAVVAPGLPARDALVQAAARTSELHLLRGLADVFGTVGSADAVVPVVEGTLEVRRQLAARPYQWWPDDTGRRPAPPAWDEPVHTAERRPPLPRAPESGSAPEPAGATAPPPPPAAAPPPPPPAAAPPPPAPAPFGQPGAPPPPAGRPRRPSASPAPRRRTAHRPQPRPTRGPDRACGCPGAGGRQRWRPSRRRCRPLRRHRPTRSSAARSPRPGSPTPVSTSRPAPDARTSWSSTSRSS